MLLRQKGSWDSCQWPILPRKNGSPPWPETASLVAGRQPFFAEEACFCGNKCLPNPEKAAGTWQAGSLAEPGRLVMRAIAICLIYVQGERQKIV